MTSHTPRRDAFLMPLLTRIPPGVKPNHLSLARLLITPPLILLILRGSFGWAFIVFILAAATDLIDGPLARTRKQHTPSGALVDAIADKVFFSTIFIILGIMLLPSILYVGIILVELATFVGGSFAASIIWLTQRRYLRIKADHYGQAKMALYLVGTGLLLMPGMLPLLYGASLLCYVLGFFLGIISMTQFLIKLAKEL